MLGQILYINGISKLSKEIEEAEKILTSNEELKNAYTQRDYDVMLSISKQYGQYGLRDDDTNTSVLASLALSNALNGDTDMLVWYIQNAPANYDSMKNNYGDSFLHSLIIVLYLKPDIFNEVRNALKAYRKGFEGYRYINAKFFARDDNNSNFGGVNPLQLAISLANLKLSDMSKKSIEFSSIVQKQINTLAVAVQQFPENIIQLMIDINTEPNHVDAFNYPTLRYLAANRYPIDMNNKLFSWVMGKTDLFVKIDSRDYIDLAIENRDWFYLVYIIFSLASSGNDNVASVIERVMRHRDDFFKYMAENDNGYIDTILANNLVEKIKKNNSEVYRQVISIINEIRRRSDDRLIK